MNENKSLTPIVKESFSQYAGAVLQSRALVDARDFLKPSARQIFYCLETDKFIHSKPMKKTLKAIGSAMRMYIHGDSSCEGVIMRAGQPWAMRYPLIEVEGGIGQPTETGNWSAPRYTSSRLSALSEYLFADIQKETIDEWRDNYDDTEKYPAVLTSKGFFNIVNGTCGIGIGMASSVPQFNLREVNKALIKLLWDPEVDFEDIYCVPDFATGAILLNEPVVKESLKNGKGFSCKLRSVIEFDSDDRCFIAKEIPYSVYTNTITNQLSEIIESENNPGIEKYNDLTKLSPNLKIYIKKNANPDRVLKYLYKNTSLQHYYGVNMTVLQDGRFPKVMGWKELLSCYLTHQKNVYTKAFLFDLRKIENRLLIIDGLKKAIARIEEVIQIIKKSATVKIANVNLQSFLNINEAQAKSILDIKLSRLAHMEIEKLEKEEQDLLKERDRINAILENEELLKKEIEKDLKFVQDNFGDDRRTRILTILEEEDEDAEPTEIKTLLISLTNKNNLLTSEVSSLYTQRKGGVGSKFKLVDGEYVIDSISTQTNDKVLFFTQSGNFYNCNASALPIEEKTNIETLFSITSERVCAMTSVNKKTEDSDIIIFTKNGMMKKSNLSEYNLKRKNSVKAIDLNENDEIVSVLFGTNEKVGILTRFGNFLICQTKDVRPVGRTGKGVKAIKLSDEDCVVSVQVISDSVKEIVSVSENGYIKRTSIEEFSIGNRYTKGSKIQKLAELDYLIDFMPIVNETEICVTSTRAQIKITKDSISLLSKNTLGNKSIKLGTKDSVISLSKF